MTIAKKRVKTPKLLIHVAVVVALGILGDTLMYSLLPLEAGNLGIPLTLVGLLLSANRLIRLFSNTWAGLAFERWGPRIPFVSAAFLALVTTALYGTGWGFLVFLIARVGWGIAWSAFRQGGYQAVWAAPENIKGRLMGILWGITRVGSAVSVVLGGFLYDRFNYFAAVGVITLITALSIPAALAIRWPQTQSVPKEERISLFRGLKPAFQTAPRRWILTVGFMDALFEGMLVSTLSLYLLTRLGASIEGSLLGIGTLAGMLIAVRYISNILFSPILGSISDRVGQPRMQVILSFITLSGMVGVVYLTGYWIIACVILVFVAGAGIFATMSAASCDLGDQTERPHLFVGVFSTAIDAGAAVSPLLAFTIGEIMGFETLYILAAALLVIACIRFWQTLKV
jgi:MFS family permease